VLSGHDDKHCPKYNIVVERILLLASTVKQERQVDAEVQV
jgi:hypothetical protein